MNSDSSTRPREPARHAKNAPVSESTQATGGAAWHPDPTGRHQLRYWDGQAWTDQVSDNGQQSTDGFAAAPPATVGYGYGQPAVPLSPKLKRLGAALLDGLLVIVTLFIGWVIWWIVLWKYGQSPAKSILKMRVIKADTYRCATVGEMAFRELVGRVLLGFIPLYSFVDNLFVLFDERSQALHDKVAGTLVIDDPDNRFAPAL